MQQALARDGRSLFDSSLHSRASLLVLEPDIDAADRAAQEDPVAAKQSLDELDSSGRVAASLRGCKRLAPRTLVHLTRVRFPSVFSPQQVAKPQHAEVVVVESAHDVR